MRTNKKLAITTVCKKYGKIACGRSITLATVQFSFFLLLIFQFWQFFFFFFCGNIIPEIPFSLSHICHIISLSSLLLFLRILALVLPNFASLLILPNKFKQY